MKILECTNPKDACQLTYEQIKEAAIKSINIKGFECFFINLGQNIGYSMLVFKNKRYIYHANEYQRYGTKHVSNDVLYKIPPEFHIYQPWEECSSAQLLIEVCGRLDNDNKRK